MSLIEWYWNVLDWIGIELSLLVYTIIYFFLEIIRLWSSSLPLVILYLDYYRIRYDISRFWLVIIAWICSGILPIWDLGQTVFVF